jgi:sugar O-acyltransferase (sialic acid O-acetyltransferase NeuD family)
MKAYYILGAGGLGRELCHWLADTAAQCAGFIDDNPKALDNYTGYPHIVGDTDTCPIDLPILCGIGQNAIRKHCVERLKARGATFASFIHPIAKVLPCTLGEGAIVAPFAYIGADATVGDFLFLQTGGVIGHDVQAGDFLRMDTTAFIGGFAKVGSLVTLHTGAKVMPSKTVGDGCTIGAGSVVITNLRAEQTVFGVPAQKL